ncbi:hypothetical protein [Iodobacter ciconiae]|uniref:Uncharacterized protein n=1 Tax=Iodobacter ciconiae TaxID=2496266 RepID=A0A3S8ZP46_9NEIS|nr:hypothetical protein [Iodobacter ciconiae]AZN35141.1 hypothetical protein EJO50_00755 [Iodobacter ciconiae]
MSIALQANTLCAAYFPNKSISLIRSDARPCTLFMLEGVTSADTATSGSPWFALKKSHPAYKENLTLLMSAKLTNKTVHITTSDAMVAECGHIEAVVVELI